VKPSFERAGVWRDDYLGDRHAWFFAVLELLKPRAKRLDDFVAHGRFFFTEAIEYETAAVQKHLGLEGMPEHLRALDAAFAELPTFDAGSIETALRSTADSRGVKPACLIHAVRVATTGKSVSPGLFDVLALVGRNDVRARLRTAAALAAHSRS
jgi:glutamyl/glutaminyl-tRNA synthetase